MPQQRIVAVLHSDDDRETGLIGGPPRGDGLGLGLFLARRIVFDVDGVTAAQVGQGYSLTAERDLRPLIDEDGRRFFLALLEKFQDSPACTARTMPTRRKSW